MPPKVKLNKKQLFKEVLRCGKDPNYFLNNYAKIAHPQRGLIAFKTYDFQSKLIESFNDHRFNICLKARQLGISTVIAGYISWLMLFHRDKNILVVSTKLATASNLVRKVKAIIKNLPSWIKISDIDTDNRNSFELTNGSQIKPSATTGDAGRSEALSLLVIDEAAFVEGMDDLWTAIEPTLSTGGRCIAVSTPNGVGNWFHKTYSAAAQGTSNFTPTKIMWYEHPDRDQEWLDGISKNLSKRELAQEHMCSFNMSGRTVFEPDDIQYIDSNTLRDPLYRAGFDRNVWIFEEYDPESEYFIVADVARGDGKDYSSFHIFKISNPMVVAVEYQGKLHVDLFGNLLNQWGRAYGNCLCVVENNNIGLAVLTTLRNLEYPKIYFSVKSTHEYIDQFEAEQRQGSIEGFSTTPKTRPLIIAKMEEFVRNRLLKVESKRLYAEMKTFIWTETGKPEAMQNYNDDLIMAAAIGCWVRDTVLTQTVLDKDYQEACILGITSTKNQLDSRIDGQLQDHHQRHPQARHTNHMTDLQNSAKQMYKEFGWVLKG